MQLVYSTASVDWARECMTPAISNYARWIGSNVSDFMIHKYVVAIEKGAFWSPSQRSPTYNYYCWKYTKWPEFRTCTRSWVFDITRPKIEPRSPEPLANTLHIQPIDGYYCWKYTNWPEFRTCTRIKGKWINTEKGVVPSSIVAYWCIALISLGKVRTQQFSLQLWANSKAVWTL